MLFVCVWYGCILLLWVGLVLGRLSIFFFVRLVLVCLIRLLLMCVCCFIFSCVISLWCRFVFRNGNWDKLFCLKLNWVRFIRWLWVWCVVWLRCWWVKVWWNVCMDVVFLCVRCVLIICCFVFFVLNWLMVVCCSWLVWLLVVRLLRYCVRWLRFCIWRCMFGWLNCCVCVRWMDNWYWLRIFICVFSVLRCWWGRYWRILVICCIFCMSVNVGLLLFWCVKYWWWKWWWWCRLSCWDLRKRCW